MGKTIFITATDTNAGKTYVSAGLLQVANARNMTTIGIKPLASGCRIHDGKLLNEDALQLQRAASCQLDYDMINPFAFAPSIAPHIAASECEIDLGAALLVKRTQPALATPADLHLIEGVGGWHTPLNLYETMADYVAQLKCEVVLVVGMRLGCLNHAVLTERAIIASGATCIGWIANQIHAEMSHQDENRMTLQNTLRSPLLGLIQYNEPAAQALQHLTIF